VRRPGDEHAVLRGRARGALQHDGYGEEAEYCYGVRLFFNRGVVLKGRGREVRKG
jgi:hypothetical protein